MPNATTPSRRPPAFRPLTAIIAGVFGCLGLAFGPLGPLPPQAAAQSTPAAIRGELGPPDIDRAIASLSELGVFFGRLAANDPNRLAAGFWSELEAQYAQAGTSLADLRARGRIRIGHLDGPFSSTTDDRAIIVDRSLDGQWQSEFVRNTRRIGGDDWSYISLLSSALLDALTQLEPEENRTWFDMHRRRSNLAKPSGGGEDAALSRSLARFWHIKDKYLWLSMPSDAESGPDAKRRREGRKIHLFSEMLAAGRAIERDLGGNWSERLTADWQDYQRMVRHFSANRGWLAIAGETPVASKPAIIDPPKPKAKPKQETVEAHQDLTAALRASQEEASRLEGETALLEEALETTRREAGAAQQRLRAELAIRREIAAALKLDLESERQAARRELEDQETHLTQALDTSRETVAALRDQLGQEREARRTETARLESGFAERLGTDREEAVQARDRLSAELGASRETVAALRDQLAQERAARRAEAARLESGFAERLESDRKEAARAREGLSADLTAAEQTAAALREKIGAERQANLQRARDLESRLAAQLKAAEAELLALGAEMDASEGAARKEIGLLLAELALESEKSREIGSIKQAQFEGEQKATPEPVPGTVTKAPPETSTETSPGSDQGPSAAAEGRETTAPGEQLALLPSPAKGVERGWWILVLGAVGLAALGLAWVAAVMLRQRGAVPAALGATAAGATARIAPGTTGPAAAPPPTGVTGARETSEKSARTEPETPTPQSLVEALRQGDVSLFAQRFSAMAGLSEAQLERILYNPSGENLAIVCRALAMDKLVLASIFLLSHKARSGGLEIKPQDLSATMAHHDRVTQEAAREVLQTWQGNLDLPGTIETNDEKPGSK